MLEPGSGSSSDTMNCRCRSRALRIPRAAPFDVNTRRPRARSPAPRKEQPWRRSPKRRCVRSAAAAAARLPLADFSHADRCLSLPQSAAASDPKQVHGRKASAAPGPAPQGAAVDMGKSLLAANPEGSKDAFSMKP